MPASRFTLLFAQLLPLPPSLPFLSILILKRQRISTPWLPPFHKPAMARSDEAEAFFHAVYTAVQEIPHGKVTSYGHIAKLIGTRMFLFLVSLVAMCASCGQSQCKTRANQRSHRFNPHKAQRPRQVGVCLKHLSHNPQSRFNNTTVPWQRVINSKGIISPRYGA